jgi:hypothetical protein
MEPPWHRILVAGVALLFPGVAVGVVAVALPEAELVVIEKCETPNPLDAFPCVEMRDD